MAGKQKFEFIKKPLRESLLEPGETWNDLFGDPALSGAARDVTINHLLMTGVVVVVLAIVAFWVRRAYSGSREEAVLPDEGLTWRNFVEFTFGYMFETMANLMERETAKRYFPLIATLTLFILFSNVLGLVPGFVPPTQNLNTSFAMAVAVFFSYNAIGFFHHGIGYLKEFTSPATVQDLVGEESGIVGMLLGGLFWLTLTVLFIFIEAVSHAFRPISLAVRLTGNMGGDHQVLAQFSELAPIGVPVPFMFLGLIVSIIQTVVFALLSVAYISLAVEGSH